MSSSWPFGSILVLKVPHQYSGADRHLQGYKTGDVGLIKHTFWRELRVCVFHACVCLQAGSQMFWESTLHSQLFRRPSQSKCC
jgi:hypothetical protein